MQGKYLITTDNWFYAPDGKQYRAVWGDVKVYSDNLLGIKTNEKSTNWFLMVGQPEDHVLIAGCQIHYAVKSSVRPSEEFVIDEIVHEGDMSQYKRSSHIYFTQ